ncbi:putative F-box/FBD/LRR-repeat protein At3g49040 [Argentina anserina]|uniref:putative F-box/FBD/LRR-repeat protein At3g49040 n=1 Tax=Argentina anserina TaxID=57926 RepID=UPI002176922C|nr:putative F-box/FBD/LRR-repeat protein At3g49040 [Potentilla anserina]
MAGMAFGAEKDPKGASELYPSGELNGMGPKLQIRRVTKRALDPRRNLRLRTEKKRNKRSGDDRISELRDDILRHILSFLVTLDCVRTTVLAKRWNNLWTGCVINLEFYAGNFRSPWSWYDKNPSKFIRSPSRLMLLSSMFLFEWIVIMRIVNVKPLLKHVFSNLIKLKLVLCDKFCWGWLNKMLEKSPNLESLVLEFAYRSSGWLWDDHFYPPESVPTCLTSQLKTIFLKRFSEEPDEIKVVKYLLYCGEVLNKLLIPVLVNL